MNVYFFCLPSGPPEAARYQHATVCLAEGLRELVVPFSASCDYWREQPASTSFLLRRDESMRPADCDVIVLESSYVHECGVPGILRARRRRFRSVLIDNADGVRTLSNTRACRHFDLVLRTHFNKGIRYATDNVKPWAFGLSNRMLQELEQPVEWAARKRSILVNFGCMHPLRRRVVSEFLPRIKNVFEIDDTVDAAPSADPYHALMWRQTGRRHYPDYYGRLKNSAASAAFGGLTPPAWECEANPLTRFLRRRREGYGNRVLTQWDSWRFWESLAAGAVTVHIDLAFSGVGLPVMPANTRHYVGIPIGQEEQLVQRMKTEEDLLRQIGSIGRDWVLKHYSPVAVAERFLAMTVPRET